MARRYHHRRSYSARSIGHERARQHIEDYHRLKAELGGSIEDVRRYFFSLKPNELRTIFDAYERRDGSSARAYAENTFDKWRTGTVHMSGTVAERLFSLLPPRMSLTAKYQLIENLWNHVGPKSKKTLRVGLDADIDQVLVAISSHIDDVVTHYRIPENLERRFNWLAAGDSHVKQDLLNHMRTLEKALVVDGARARLPVVLEHLRSEAGRHTQRVADVLKIGNHELELSIDKNASGVAVVEPYVPLRSAISRATATASGQRASFKWVWWAAAAAVVLYLFAGPQTSKPSYYSPPPAPSYHPPTPAPSYHPPAPAAPAIAPLPQPTAMPSRQADIASDHGPGRVACDVRWSELHRPDSVYQDFIRDCMKRPQ